MVLCYSSCIKTPNLEKNYLQSIRATSNMRELFKSRLSRKWPFESNETVAPRGKEPAIECEQRSTGGGRYVLQAQECSLHERQPPQISRACCAAASMLGVTTMIMSRTTSLEALSMDDMIAVMHDGELQRWGTSRDIFNHPTNAWVASFVGEPAMNFMTCEVQGRGQDVILGHRNFTIPLKNDQIPRLNGSFSGGTVRMGVRPDALSITMHPPKEVAITGNIFVNERLGGDMIVEVQVGDTRHRVKTTPDFAGSPGETCYLTVDRDRWHVFDAGDGHAYF